MSNNNGLISTPGVFFTGDPNSTVYIPEGGDVIVNNVTTQEIVLDGQTLTAQGDTLFINGVPVGGSGQVGSLSQVLAQGNSAGSTTINMNGQKITSLATPTVSTDASTKAYADTKLALAGGTMAGPITLSQLIADTNTGGVLTVDGDILLTSGNNISCAALTAPTLNTVVMNASTFGQPISFNAPIQMGNNNIATTGAINVGSLYTNNIIANTNNTPINIGSNASAVNITQPVTLGANNVTTSGTVTAGTVNTSNLTGSNGIELNIGSGSSGVSMLKDVNMDGNDITDVNDITMTGAVATITNTGGTINIAGLGTSINSLGSVAINSANALGFSSSIEKFSMKDNTMSSTNATDLTFNDVASLGNSNGNVINMDAPGNSIAISGTGVAIDVNAGDLTMNNIRGGVTSSNILYYNASNGIVSFSPPPSAPGTSPFCATTTLSLNTTPYTITSADIGKAYAFTQTNPLQQITFFNFLNQTDPAFENGYVTIYNAGNSGTTATGYGRVRIEVPVNASDAQLERGESAIVQYFTISPGVYQPRVIATYQFTLPSLSAVLEVGNTTGAQDIVMGDGGATKANLTNAGTMDVVNLQVGVLQPLEPLLPGNINIGVQGNLVFDPDVPQTGSISNITELTGVATDAIAVNSSIDMNGNSISNVGEVAGTSLTVSGSNKIEFIAGGTAVLEMAPSQLYAQVPLNMFGNAITNCPTITAIEGDVSTLQGEVAALQTDKLDKSSALYVNSYYVNDNVNDIQTVIDTIGSDQGNVIYVGAGSYGGSTVSITQLNNCAIQGPVVGGPSVICELAGGRGMTITSGAQRLRISSIQIEGLFTLGASGNNYFQSVQAIGGLTISAGATGNYFFYDCEFGGAITVPSTFAGVIGFIRCNFASTTFSLNNASPLQVQFTQALGLVATYPLKAIYGGTNQLASGAVFEGVNSIIPVGATTFSTTGCSTLASDLTYDSGSGALSLISQSGATLKTITVSGGGGGGGGSNFFEYQAIVATQGPPIGDGHIEWNNATQQNATIVYVSHLTSDGNDIDVFLTSVRENDTLIIQDRNNSANYQKWTVSGTPTQVPNDYYGFPVTLVESTVSFTGSQAIALIVLETRGVQSVSAGAGITVTGTALEPIVNADVVNVSSGSANVTVVPTAGDYAISVSAPNLSQVLVEGNSAGANDIDMNGNGLTNVNSLYVTDIHANPGETGILLQSNLTLNFNDIGSVKDIYAANVYANVNGSLNNCTLNSCASSTLLDMLFNNIVNVGAIDVLNVNATQVRTSNLGGGTTGTAIALLDNIDMAGYDVGNATLVDTTAIEVETISGRDPGQPGSQWTSQECANLASDLDWTEGTRTLQLVSQTGVPIGSGVVISGGGGGGSQTLEQVLTTGNDAGGLSISNLGTLNATNVIADSVSLSNTGAGVNTPSVTSTGNILTLGGLGVSPKVSLAGNTLSMGGSAGGPITDVSLIAGPTSGAPLNFTTVGLAGTSIQFKPANALALYMDGNQRVGIRTNTPTEALEVNGNIKLEVGNSLLGNVTGNLTGTASVASNLAGKSAHKLPYYNGTAVLSYADTTSAGYICSTDGNDVQFVNPNTLSVASATNVLQTAGLLYNGTSNVTSVLSAGTTGHLVGWSSGVPVTINPATLTVAEASLAGSATTAGRANNITSASSGIPYNSASNTTAFLSGLGTNGQLVTTTGSALTYTSPSALTVGSASNVVGGSAGNLVYQSGSGATTFLANGTQGQVLVQGPTTPLWQSVSLPLGYINIAVTGASNLSLTQSNFTNVLQTSQSYTLPIGNGTLGFRISQPSNGSAALTNVQISWSMSCNSDPTFASGVTTSLAQGQFTLLPTINGGNTTITFNNRTLLTAQFIRVTAFLASASFIAGPPPQLISLSSVSLNVVPQTN